MARAAFKLQEDEPLNEQIASQRSSDFVPAETRLRPASAALRGTARTRRCRIASQNRLDESRTQLVIDVVERSSDRRPVDAHSSAHDPLALISGFRWS